MWKHAIALFGNGLDLSIYDECDKTDDNYSYLGSTFKAVSDNPKDKACLAQKKNFKVLDIMVYAVVNKPIQLSFGNQAP